jgi:GNAT superfamily N-acetyltransferase
MSKAELPGPVRDLAERPIAMGPPAPPESPFERLLLPTHAVLVLPGPGGLHVEPGDLGTYAVERLVDDVRTLARERGKSRVAWTVAPSARPPELAAQLLRCGLRPYAEPPFEPAFAAMVLLEAPEPAPQDVVARAVETFEEFHLANHLAEDVFEVPEEDRKAFEAHDRLLFDLEASGRLPVRTYAAFLDGEIVGSAGALLADAGVNLVGGSVRPEARGRGVYRALVRARWDDAAARGTPALTVSAGALSRPILERLGFVTVGEVACLLDVVPEA